MNTKNTKNVLIEVARDLYDAGWVSSKEFEHFESGMFVNDLRERRRSALINLCIELPLLTIYGITQFRTFQGFGTTDVSNLVFFGMPLSGLLMIALLTILACRSVREFRSSTNQLSAMR